MNTNIEHQTSSDPLDEYISGTLRSDAESLRARFATVPNNRLTTKLAFQTATNGLFRSLGTKFTMYAGAAAIVAGALYFMPKKATEPVPVSKSVAPPAALAPSSAPAITPQNETVAVQKESNSSHKLPSHTPAKSEEGKERQIPVITDKNLKGPVN